MPDQFRRWIIPVITLAALWFAIAVIIVGYNAVRAKSSLDAVKESIAAGEQEQAASQLAIARGSTAAIRRSLNYSPLAAFNLVPLFRTNIRGTDTLLQAAEQLLPVAGQTNELYAALSGDDDPSEALFSDGTIRYQRLEQLAPELSSIAEQVDRARTTLDSGPENLVGPLAVYRDRARAEVAGIAQGLAIVDDLLPDLPQLLGSESPQKYLVVFHNPAELFPGGGASLSVALLQFDQGAMTVLDKGAVSTQFFWRNPRVPWDPVAEDPYFARENARDGFAWANLHPDYRIAGEDLMRSWVANGQDPVDGVISLDPLAIEAVVAATGPIESPGYGSITADNLVEKLLYEGYEDFEADQSQRHDLNNDLIDGMLTRLEDGGTALSIGRAIFATAPQQHIRIHLSDNRLADILAEAKADGAQPEPQADRIAFYTQNQNQSKVDIFQRRSVTHDVKLTPGGGATVTQTAVITNNAPDTGWPLTERVGYRTRWAFHWNVVHLPSNAEDVKIGASPGEIRRDDRPFTDVDGRQVVRIGRWTPPGESSTIVTTYRLPDGTFGDGQELTYRASLENQLLLNGTALTVRVTGPGSPEPVLGRWDLEGSTATLKRQLLSPEIIEVTFTS